MTYSQRVNAIRINARKARAAREFKRNGGVFGAIYRFLFEV